MWLALWHLKVLSAFSQPAWHAHKVTGSFFSTWAKAPLNLLSWWSESMKLFFSEPRWMTISIGPYCWKPRSSSLQPTSPPWSHKSLQWVYQTGPMCGFVCLQQSFNWVITKWTWTYAFHTPVLWPLEPVQTHQNLRPRQSSWPRDKGLGRFGRSWFSPTFLTDYGF